MKKYIQIGLLCFLFPIAPKAQVVDRLIKRDNAVTPLNYGDKLPDIYIKNILRYSRDAANLSDLTKGKLVIIDFSATWCGSCIESMPHLDSLQQLFKDQIIILPVSYEDPKIVMSFLNKNANMKGLKLPFIAGDNILNSLFPHRTIPHDVIIDANGIYKTATTPEFLTKETIASLIGGTTTLMFEKKDNLTFNKAYPLLVNGNGGYDTAFSYRSVLTHYLPGVPSGYTANTTSAGKFYRISATNIYPIKLFTIAFGKSFFVENKNRMAINIPDSGFLFPPRGPHTEWSLRNDVSYELLLPNAVPDSVIFRYMLDDLNRLFDIKGSIEKREMNCWAIVRISTDNALLASKGGKKLYANTGRLQNVTLKSMINYLNNYHDLEEVIDETNLFFPVDMDLTFVSEYTQDKYPDISAIRGNLNKYGLDIQKVKRKRDVLIIDKK